MERRIVPCIFALVFAWGPGARRSNAQAALADDIIIAAQGKENARRHRKTELGHAPGTSATPYRNSPGSSDIILGSDPNRRVAPLPRLSRRLVNPAAFAPPDSGVAEPGHGLAPAIERLRIPATLRSPEIAGPSTGPREDLADDEGPPDGLTLDAAIDRLVRTNRELRTKFLELPQAEADIVSAGLRSNPLFFYSSDGIPYGSYSERRPGDISHGVSLVYPIDFSGKRRTRTDLARREKSVLVAQYQDAVRLEIDHLYTAYVDVLAARQAVRAAEGSIGLLDRLLAEARAKTPRDAADEDALDDLTIERDIAAMAVGDERERYEKAKQGLGALLELSPAEAGALELRGSARVMAPKPPPVEVLVDVALRHRPDLIAHRLGVERARAELAWQDAERFSDAYFLYTPYGFRDSSQLGLQSATSWGAGLFVSVPLFDRNQGNLRRAAINIDQSRNECASREHQVVSEVRQAARDFANTYDDILRLEQVTLPAVRRKRDRTWRRLGAGEIGTDTFLSVQRDSTSLVRYYRDTTIRHRRNMLKLNTAVGQQVLP